MRAAALARRRADTDRPRRQRRVTLTAPAYAAHPYELFTDHTTAKAITVHPVSGHVRVGASGVDAQPTTDTVYCLGSGSSRPTPPSRSAG